MSDPLGVTLSPEALRTLKRSIGEIAGPLAADDVLFRVGRRWGERDAGLTRGARERGAGEAGEHGARRAWLERGLEHLDGLGLASVQLESCELDRRSCRVVGRVLDGVELQAAEETQTPPQGPVCSMTVGYLTGLVAAISGQDVVCTPFECVHDCAGQGLCAGCAFVITPAVEAARDLPLDKAPSGSARFYLGSVGMAMGEGDLALDDLLENTTDAIILMDSDDVIRFWNRGAERMFGYPREESVGRKAGFIVPLDLVKEGELGRLQAMIERQGAISNHITRRVRKDGTELWVSITRALLRDSHGNVIGSTANIRDISTQRKTEEELLAARSLAIVGELAAKIAHEIKNPLAGISVAIQLLARGLEPGDEKKKIFDEVRNEIRRLDETTLDLLRFARPVPPRLSPTDLGNFIRDVIEPLRRAEDIDKLEVQIDVAEGIIVPMDAKNMSQVFTNLILNAGHATPAGGSLHIAAEQSNGGVVVTLSDSGEGIPKEIRTSIFEPFFTTKARGTGLGLSIAKKNVEAHDGTIEVESGRNGGTRFRITLPTDADGRRP